MEEIWNLLVIVYWGVVGGTLLLIIISLVFPTHIYSIDHVSDNKQDIYNCVLELVEDDLGIRIRKPDITKARTILGWEPKVDRAEGLKKTYDYFKALPPSEWTKLPKEFNFSNKY